MIKKVISALNLKLLVCRDRQVTASLDEWVHPPAFKDPPQDPLFPDRRRELATELFLRRSCSLRRSSLARGVELGKTFGGLMPRTVRG